ncbi:hypothetical protein D3C72_1929800 [compost metagenome]
MAALPRAPMAKAMSCGVSRSMRTAYCIGASAWSPSEVVPGSSPDAWNCPWDVAQTIESTLPLKTCPGTVRSDTSTSLPGFTFVS